MASIELVFFSNSNPWHKDRGILSITSQPRSSNVFNAVVFPDPDIPVTIIREGFMGAC
jgi:hypothetical protein